MASIPSTRARRPYRLLLAIWLAVGAVAAFAPDPTPFPQAVSVCDPPKVVEDCVAVPEARGR